MLFQCFGVGSHPWDAHSLNSTWVLATGSARKPPHFCASLHGPFGCLLLCGHFTGCSFLQGMSACSNMGLSVGCRLILICASLWTSAAAGAQLSYHSLHHGLQENLRIQHLKCLLLLVHWPWCLQGCFSHVFIPVLQLLHCILYF